MSRRATARRLIGGGLAIALMATLASGPAIAAAKRKALSLTLPSDQNELPEPPIPPNEPQFGDAPLPGDLPALPGQADSNTGVTVSPNLFKPKDYNLGSGYTNGSTIQGEERRRFAPTPGINLNVPLQ
jgi:hypothetical protein